MTVKTKRLGLATLVAGLVLGIGAFAAPAVKAIKAAKNSCPSCKMAQEDDEPDADVKAQMRAAGITEQMLMRTRGMMNAPLYGDSPSVLLGMDEQLKLTPEQTQKLREIEKNARRQAAQVLTQDQKSKVGQVVDKPATLRDNIMEIHQKMEKAMDQQGGQDAPSQCPMAPDQSSLRQTKRAQ